MILSGTYMEVQVSFLDSIFYTVFLLATIPMLLYTDPVALAAPLASSSGLLF